MMILQQMQRLILPRRVVVVQSRRSLQPTQRTVLPAKAVAVQSRKSRQQFSRTAVWVGVVVFTTATIGLSAIVEVAKPEWRDPEFGHRLKQVKKWKAEAPDRPIVLLIGTSRVQMGMSPAAMDFPNEPGSPLVYNCGYRGATPLWCCMQAQRWLDSDVKPSAILFSLSNWEMLTPTPAEQLYEKWASRLSRGDLDRLALYSADPTVLPRLWRQARWNPWDASREAIACEQLPDWHTVAARRNCLFATSWKDMDCYGFSPWPTRVREQDRQQFLAMNRTVVLPLMAGIPVGQLSDRGLRDLVLRCQREGVAIAGITSPESPTYRSWYSAKGRAIFDQYTRSFSEEMGVPIFPAPDNDLVEEDFADGYHLIGPGAAKYSRWLADTHIKPWLASRTLR